MNRRYMLFERNGKYREDTPEKTAKNLKLIDIFDDYATCLDKWLEYGITMGDPRKQMTEHFVVLVDNNNKYIGTIHGFDVLQMNIDRQNIINIKKRLKNEN